MVGKVGTRGVTVLAAGALGIGLCTSATASAGTASQVTRAAQAQSTAAPCVLGPSGSIRHVIYMQFDNVHFTRDNPNVPSDLEQMPNLLSFITGQGTLVSHEHTPLIAHTADDIVTSESGLYGSDQGIPGRERVPVLHPGRHDARGWIVRLLGRPDRRLRHRPGRHPGRRQHPDHDRQ